MPIMIKIETASAKVRNKMIVKKKNKKIFYFFSETLPEMRYSS